MQSASWPLFNPPWQNSNDNVIEHDFRAEAPAFVEEFKLAA